MANLSSENIAIDGDWQICPANYSYRWGLANLSSEIIATDGDWQICPVKL